LKVLQIIPALELGGAETYVCRLARGLVARGHEVTLLTQGGMLEALLEGAGVRLLRGKVAAAQAKEWLCRLAAEQFDIVNVHNYKAAYLAQQFHALRGWPYVMTVHGPRSLWYRLRFRAWSPWVIALSEGDRDNVTGVGGIARERVRLSFYGMDTDRFRPGYPGDDLRREWGLPEGAPIILHISRFSHRKGRVAWTLLEAVEQVWAAFPEAVALLVGRGPGYERLVQRSVHLNRRRGRLSLLIQPARLDLPRVMNLAHVLVATANTALEGMCCAVPTLAAGRTGYWGPVTPDNFEAARALCFADHGRAPFPLSVDRLAQDLLATLSHWEEARRRAQTIREWIEERYSVARMAEHIEGLYQEVIARSQ